MVTRRHGLPHEVSEPDADAVVEVPSEDVITQLGEMVAADPDPPAAALASPV